MLTKKFIKRAVSIVAISSMAICGTLIASAKSVNLNGATVYYASDISKTKASATTNINSTGPVQVSSTYRYVQGNSIKNKQ